MPALDQINQGGTIYEIVPEIAELFKTTKAYHTGDHVIYEAGWYTFKADKSAGAWDATKVDGPFKVTDQISSIKEDLNAEVDEIKEDLTQVATTYTGKNLHDYTQTENNKYLNPNGTMEDLNGRYVTGYIPVVSGKIVTSSYINAQTVQTQQGYSAICCYDKDKNVVSGGNYNKTTFTVPSGVAFVRLTFGYNAFTSALSQIELTTDGVPTSFEFYIGSNTHLSSDMVIAPKPMGFFRVTGDIGDGETLRIDKYHNVKNDNIITFTGRITTFGTLKIGKQSNTYIEIDDTNVTFYNDTQDPVSEPHGLTIGNDIQVKITNDCSLSVKVGQVRIVSSGNVWTSQNQHRFCMDEGKVFATSDGSVLTDCVLSWTSRNINKPIWLFGDSYFSWYESRWTYYLAQDGYTDSCLINGYAGEASEKAFEALQTLLSIRVPDKVVWCLGMNNADGESAVSKAWNLYYNALIGLSNYYGFELILATIPNCPSVNNNFKNAIVKASGYRYIDFAGAVNVGTDGTWIDGTIETAENPTHPNAKGAKILYGQVLVDLPEIVSKS